MSKEAMKLALEALKQIDEAMPFPVAKLAQSALREALAEQPAQQEPVAWICEGSSSDEKHAIDYWPGDIEDIPIGTKLYTSPQAQQEPVATVTSETGADISMSWWHEPALPVGTKLYTAPPQRTWVGLTDAEVMQTMSGDWTSQFYFARAIEAKLKEKNT